MCGWCVKTKLNFFMGVFVYAFNIAVLVSALSFRTKILYCGSVMKFRTIRTSRIILSHVCGALPTVTIANYPLETENERRKIKL